MSKRTSWADTQDELDFLKQATKGMPERIRALEAELEKRTTGLQQTAHDNLKAYEREKARAEKAEAENERLKVWKELALRHLGYDPEWGSGRESGDGNGLRGEGGTTPPRRGTPPAAANPAAHNRRVHRELTGFDCDG